LDRYLFGVEVEQVQEVLRYMDMTCVPLASQAVKGLINLRGQIVPALDLRRMFQLEARAEDQRPMNVVLLTADGVVSLLVDEIGEVMEVQEADFEPKPETLRGVARDLVAGVFKLPGQLLLVLDTARAVDVNAVAEIGSGTQLKGVAK